MTIRLLERAHAEQVTLWYAPGSSDAVEKAQRLASDYAAGFRRCPISRKAVDRLAMRAGLPVWKMLNIGSADVAWSPDFTVPPAHGARCAITVHDLAWMTTPDYTPPGLRSFLDRVAPGQIRRAERVFVVSETTKAALLKQFAIDEGKVVVAPNGVDERFLAAGLQPNPSVLSDLTLPHRYLLMTGTIEPRKNHLRVLQAVRSTSPDVPLVIAGGLGWDYEPVLQELAKSDFADRVRYVGFVDEAILPQLYANADVLIAASVEEGFDLPVLEGMAAGVPLLLSDIPVHREVAGDLASYFDPYSVESIGDGIIALISRGNKDSALAFKQREAASTYSWETGADRIWKALGELA